MSAKIRPGAVELNNQLTTSLFMTIICATFALLVFDKLMPVIGINKLATLSALELTFAYAA